MCKKRTPQIGLYEFSFYLPSAAGASPSGAGAFSSGAGVSPSAGFSSLPSAAASAGASPSAGSAAGASAAGASSPSAGAAAGAGLLGVPSLSVKYTSFIVESENYGNPGMFIPCQISSFSSELCDL